MDNLSVKERIDAYRKARSDSAKRVYLKKKAIAESELRLRVAEEKEALKQEAIKAGITDKFLLERPKKRSECIGAIRPCPWVSCKYHALVDITEFGRLVSNSPKVLSVSKGGHMVLNEDAFLKMSDSCVLDIVDKGLKSRNESEDTENTLDKIGVLWNLSRERVRQIEDNAMEKMSCYPALKELLKESLESETSSRMYCDHPIR